MLTSTCRLDNLISRLEEPNSAARWDAPLITIPHFDPPLTTPPSNPSSPDVLGSVEAERVWAAITTGDIKPPNIATLPVHTSATSYLTLLESTTSLLITTLLARQALSPLNGTTSLVVPTQPESVRVELTLHRSVSMAMLQRLKRQFTKFQQQMGNEMDTRAIATLFADYLEANV